MRPTVRAAGALEKVSHGNYDPYEQAPREKIKLPKRQKADGYQEPNYPFRFVEEKF